MGLILAKKSLEKIYNFVKPVTLLFSKLGHSKKGNFLWKKLSVNKITDNNFFRSFLDEKILTVREK